MLELYIYNVISVYRMETDLIDMSDSESEDFPYLGNNDEHNHTDIIANDPTNKINTNIIPTDDLINGEGTVSASDITLIKKENIEHENPNVMEFIKFCVDMRLFDETFYDFGNAFSIMPTKLPSTFDLISLDSKIIQKSLFYNFFNIEFTFNGDINDIFSEIDKDEKGHITWEDFIEFFIPFVKYVTI